MDSRSDTAPYSIALFCCIVLAVFTYFFPLTAQTRMWQAVVIWMLALASNAVYFKKDELKNKMNRSFNETVAYVDTFAVEVLYIVFLPLKIMASRPEFELGPSIISVVDAYLYAMLFVLYLQYGTLGIVASEKGKRGGLVGIGGFLCALACIGLFYYEVSSPGVALPPLVQPVCFLPALFLLLRLRALESYGHI